MVVCKTRIFLLVTPHELRWEDISNLHRGSVQFNQEIIVVDQNHPLRHQCVIVCRPRGSSPLLGTIHAPETKHMQTLASSTSSPPIAHFITYALYRTRLTSSVTFAALYLL